MQPSLPWKAMPEDRNETTNDRHGHPVSEINEDKIMRIGGDGLFLCGVCCDAQKRLGVCNCHTLDFVVDVLSLTEKRDQKQSNPSAVGMLDNF
jgi:hypothetical protein